MLYDMVVIQIAALMAIWIRFDMQFTAIPGRYLDVIVRYMPINTAVTIVVFMLFNLYEFMWSYVGLREALQGTAACITASILQWAGFWVLGFRMPRSYMVFYPICLCVFTVGPRFAYRFLRAIEVMHTPKNVANVMIVGAGEAALTILLKFLFSYP